MQSINRERGQRGLTQINAGLGLRFHRSHVVLPIRRNSANGRAAMQPGGKALRTINQETAVDIFQGLGWRVQAVEFRVWL
jgi:hypothetical protein